MKTILTMLIVLMMSGCSLTNWFTKDKAKTLVDLIPDKPAVVKPEITPEPVKPADPDIDLIKSFQWTETGDGGINQCEHGSIVKTYTGYITNPFEVLATVPQDFTLGLGHGGMDISIPKSDPTGHMVCLSGDRTAFLCLFNSNKELLQVEDFSNSTHFDNRWADKPVTYGVVFHCIGYSVVSRSQVFKCGQFRTGGE